VSADTNGYKRVVVLGSTGSIGTSCLDVIEALPDRLRAVGLSAHSSWQTLFSQAARHRPRWVTITDPTVARSADLPHLNGTRVLVGPEGVAEMVSDPEVDVVLSAIVGTAGLEGTWAALEHG
jgi:1-deoxy-D-xylulose-5-phosphate reductoisomerase